LFSCLYSSAVPIKKMTGKKAAKTAPKKRPGAKARAEAVKKLLLRVEKKMAEEDVKATLADYIRLIQLQKEMSDEPKTEITVTWIEAVPDLTGE